MQVLQKYQQLFDTYLQANPFNGHPNELYEPANYIMQLGGKRLRPGIAMMGYELYDSNVERVLPVAMAVEVFHNFSLVHDDIMDEALMRRGKPSVHAKFGENTAILSGDVMLVLAYEVLTKIDKPNLIPQLVKVFNRQAIEVCEGQQLDMNFETREDVSIEEYIHMISQKTAALIGGSLELGAIVGGASDDDLKNLQLFGRNIGIAFQLQDDYLDTFGDPKKFGKKIGGDIAQNKKTFLILKALEVASENQKDQLAKYMQKDSQLADAEKITLVTQLLEEIDIPRYALDEKEKYRDLAFGYLDQVNVADEKKQPIIELSELIIGREK
ncbi:MAG: polyprenyl synthetase family protein [Bacteroidota bacterium]